MTLPLMFLVNVVAISILVFGLYPELPHNKWTQALRRPWAVVDERVIALAS